MTDPRWDELGAVLVGHSTRVAPGERVLIALGEVEALPLARAVYGHAVRAGGLPHVQFGSALLERELLLHGSDEQLDWVPELEARGLEWADVYVGLRALRNPGELEGVPPARLAAHRRALGTLSALRDRETRWVLVRVPTEPFAQQAGASLDEVLERFFGASLRDWAAEAERLRALAERFEAAETVRIVGRGTDLAFSTRGRRYAVGDGTHNMPDGEIYTAPVDGSAEGEIAFELPGSYGGAPVEGIRLELRAGRVERATATAGQDLLDRLLATDEGASRLGEFGVGANPGVDRFVGDILWDEKIGGTIHLALGRAYAECGGVNASAVHWDLVKDLREEGALELDGRRVFENGRWLGYFPPDQRSR